LGGQPTSTKPTESNLEASCALLLNSTQPRVPRPSSSTSNGIDSSTSASSSSCASTPEDFFYSLRARRKTQLVQGPDDAGSEVNKYLEDTATDPESHSLFTYQETIYLLEHWPTI